MLVRRTRRLLSLWSAVGGGALAVGCGGSADNTHAQHGGGGGGGVVGANTPVAGSSGAMQALAGSSGAAQALAGSSGATQAVAGGGPNIAPTGFEKLRFEVIGGYGPEPCRTGKDSYEVTRASRKLAWLGCDYTTTPAGPLMGERTLSEGELQAVTEGLGRVSSSSKLSCGADASVLTLDLTTSSSIEYYADDFYSDCPWDLQLGRTFVSGLGHLHRVLWDLVRQ